MRSEACVRVCREEGEWFRVGVGLRQGCVMSPWLFNVFMDGVMKEVREAVGDVGATLWDARSNSEWKVSPMCMRTCEHVCVHLCLLRITVIV